MVDTLNIIEDCGGPGSGAGGLIRDPDIRYQYSVLDADFRVDCSFVVGRLSVVLFQFPTDSKPSNGQTEDSRKWATKRD